jgi:hypothetical protein
LRADVEAFVADLTARGLLAYDEERT